MSAMNPGRGRIAMPGGFLLATRVRSVAMSCASRACSYCTLTPVFAVKPSSTFWNAACSPPPHEGRMLTGLAAGAGALDAGRAVAWGGAGVSVLWAQPMEGDDSSEKKRERACGEFTGTSGLWARFGRGLRV